MSKLLKLSSALFAAVLLVFAFHISMPHALAAEKAVYVKDGGRGNGSSASVPCGSLSSAYSYLGEGGGTIVICGKTTLSSTLTPVEHSGKVVITSCYGGVDYRVTNNASLVFLESMYLSGDTEFNELNIIATVASGASSMYPYRSISARGHDITMGKGINCTLDNGCKTNVSVIGGSGKAYNDITQNIVFESGTWQRVRGGASKAGSEGYNINFTVNGGTFAEKLVLSSGSASGPCSHNGNVNAVINGGNFYGGIFLSAFNEDSDTFEGNVSVVLNGGTVYGDLSVACRRIGIFNGNYKLTVNGGDLTKITELTGSALLKGNMQSSLEFGEDTEPYKEQTGNITFTNYLRVAADPFMFYHNNSYYFTSTGGTSISIYRVTDIANLSVDASTVVFQAPPGLRNTWSPEIHYFSAEEIGAEYAGWYMFLGLTDDNASSGQRQYVLKCLDGDYLEGRWGNPITGEVNMPQKIVFTNDGGENFNEDQFCSGTSVLRLGGKAYLTFVSERGRGSSAFHQTINITTFKTPWIVDGVPVELCRSEYTWESQGYGYSSANNTWYPKVVEGCSPVYGDDGSVYLMYTGSGYWTTYYALGYMKYVGGDPLSKSSWVKNPSPVLVRESRLTATSVNGCGHGSYFKDAEGNTWVCYHGYVGKNTDSGRFAFVERIYPSKEGVYIGNGTSHPAPLSTEYTVKINPLPVGEKVSGFGSVTHIHNVHKFTKQLATDEYKHSDATCITAALYYYSCEECGKKGDATFEYGEKAACSFGTTLFFSANEHYLMCGICNTKTEIAAHEYNSEEVCDACGYRRGMSAEIHGTVISFGGEGDAVTVKLIKDGIPVDSAEINGCVAEFSFVSVIPGEYTVRISKSMHADAEYRVNVFAAGVDVGDLPLLLYGDVNGDGKVNASDATQIKRYYNNKNSVFSSADKGTLNYLKKVADVNADGNVNASDATQIKRYYNNKPSVFDLLKES